MSGTNSQSSGFQETLATSLSVSAICYYHTVCLMGSGWLFSSPLLWLLLAVGPQSWNLKESLVSINCIFTNDLLAFLQSLWPLHMVSSLSLFSMTTLILQSPLQLRQHLHHWPLTVPNHSWCPCYLHAFKTRTLTTQATLTHYKAHLTEIEAALASSGAQFLFAESWEILPEDFT